jgi:hypothetical protein
MSQRCWTDSPQRCNTAAAPPSSARCRVRRGLRCQAFKRPLPYPTTSASTPLYCAEPSRRSTPGCGLRQIAWIAAGNATSAGHGVQGLNHEYMAQPGRLRRPGRGLKESEIRAKRKPTAHRHRRTGLDRRSHCDHRMRPAGWKTGCRQANAGCPSRSSPSANGDSCTGPVPGLAD